MRKAAIFFDAITDISEELIDSALDYRFTKKAIRWQRYMSMAACLVLVTVIGFGAAQLGILGGSSKSDSGSNMAADTAAPENGDRKGSVSEESAAEDSASSSADAGGNTTTDSTEEGKNEPVEPVRFGATVLQVEENWILVEPLEKDELRSVADRFMVSISGAEELPELKEGCEVVIFFNGFIRESYPPQIDAIRIKPLMRELGDN